MRILQQSPTLREAFKKQVDKRISQNRQAMQESLGGGFFGSLGSVVFEINRFSNHFKGSIGEGVVSLLLKFLPDTWVMFNNALIPTKKAGILTEIDHLIIGLGGVFLVEVKTWKGSFSARKDKWKRREGNNWVPISQSPTSQSAYHQKMFKVWMGEQSQNLNSELVTAPVVFTVAKWVGTTDCSVPVLHGISALLELVTNSPNCLTETQVLEIAKIIENYTIPVSADPTLKSLPKPIIKGKNMGDRQP